MSAIEYTLEDIEREHHCLQLVTLVSRDPVDLLSAVAKKYGVAVADITGPSLKRLHVQPRREVALQLKRDYRWSYPDIGRFLHRDHSSIICLLRKKPRCKVCQSRRHASEDHPSHVPPSA